MGIIAPPVRIGVPGGAASYSQTASNTSAITTLQAGQTAGTVAYDTLALLSANLSPADGAPGQVLNDGANNGFYVKAGASGSGSWVKKSNATVPGLDARTDTLGGDDGISGYLYTLRDKLRRALMRFDTDGTLLTKLGIVLGPANGLAFSRGADGRYTLSFGDAAGRIPVGGGVIDPSVATTDGDLWRLRDSMKRVLLRTSRDGWTEGRFRSFGGVPYATLTDVGNAGGLTTRFNINNSAYGLPLIPVYGDWFLRETRQRLSSLMLGGTGQVVMAFQGDSWSFTPGYYTALLARYLIAKYGDAGPGYCGFGYSPSTAGNGNVRPEVLAYSRTGSWVSVYGTAPMPDHSMVTSSTASDTITLTYTKPSGGPDISLVRIFALASTDGQAQYRTNGGTWTALNLTGSGLSLTDITALPTGSFTLDIQVVSGTCQLGGADYQAATKGVRFHKLGSSGTRSSQWASADGPTYQAALTALAPNMLSILGATNSQSQYDAETERGYVQTVITRWKTALPFADLMLATPPENGRAGNPFPMSGFADVHRQLAQQNKMAHLDLQYAFGDDVSQYDFGTSRPWLISDHLHPSLGDNNGTVIGANTGANVIFGEYRNLLRAN